MHEANDRGAGLRMEQHERRGITADPHGDPLLRRFLVVSGELAAALSAAVLKQPLDVSMTVSRYAEVERVEFAGTIEGRAPARPICQGRIRRP